MVKHRLTKSFSASGLPTGQPSGPGDKNKGAGGSGRPPVPQLQDISTSSVSLASHAPLAEAFTASGQAMRRSALA